MNYPAAHPETGASATADLGRYRLQDLLGQAPAGIGLLSGPEQRWIYVNDYYVRMTGRTSAADFIGKTIRESLPEIESQGFNELREKVYRTGEPYVGREMMAKLNRSCLLYTSRKAGELREADTRNPC